MEYIKKEELKDGEIYKVNLENSSYIVKITHNFVNCININMKIDILYKQGNFSNSEIFKFSLATSEEKHWLNTCIKLDKFITFEEAMKTFIPKYVECTQEQYPSSYKVGIIYKLKNTLIENEIGGMAYWRYNQHRFKPSTKEAYDAQFVVIEPLPQFKVIETIETITKVENNEGNQFFIGDVVISSNGTVQTIESFDYNKAKTNIIAFTNKQSKTGNGIGIDKIEHYIEPQYEKYFSTKEKAEEYILMNKPVLNLNDVINNISYDVKFSDFIKLNKHQFTELVKSKL